MMMLCECCGVNQAASTQPEGTRLYTPPARCIPCKGCAYTKGCVVNKPGYFRSGKGAPPPGHKWKKD